MQKVILITFYFDSRNYVATTKDKTFGYCRRNYGYGTVKLWQLKLEVLAREPSWLQFTKANRNGSHGGHVMSPIGLSVHIPKQIKL